MAHSADPSDLELLTQTALAFVHRHGGASAVAELEGFADIATGIGDDLSTDTWLEIADAVADLFMQQGTKDVSLILHRGRASVGSASSETLGLPTEPVAVERWHAVKARTLAFGMPSHLAEQLTRIAGDMERHATSLAARTESLSERHRDRSR